MKSMITIKLPDWFYRGLQQSVVLFDQHSSPVADTHPAQPEDPKFSHLWPIIFYIYFYLILIGAAAYRQLGGGNQLFSHKELWPQTQRSRLSSWLLHVWLQTTPVHTGVHRPKKPIEPLHLRKAWNTVRMFSNWTHSWPWLRLDLVHEGQPWPSSTPSRNLCDFVQRIQTQLSLRLYRVSKCYSKLRSV